MFCINLDTNDPFFNLAIEELLLKTSKEEYLILGVNNPSVIIGKHQSGHREVNTKFVTENKIPVIRRISGGGTVFHDTGNLNFSFICNSESGKQIDFRKYTQPVISFLISIGVEARFEGKNDLKVEGFKISGNAEHIHGNRVLHHGTLLFNTSLDMLRNSIRKDASCYTSRAVASNPATVINLIGRINCYNNLDEFKSAMMIFFLGNFPDNVPYQLTGEEISQAESIADSKYRTWEWNWAYGPEYTFINHFELNRTNYSCRLAIKDGIIIGCSIEGSELLKKFSEKLVGCRHMVRELSDLFRAENIFLSNEAVYNFF